MTDTHWTKEPLTKWIYFVFWVVLFALIMAIRWVSPLCFEIFISAMVTTAVLRIALLEIEAGI